MDKLKFAIHYRRSAHFNTKCIVLADLVLLTPGFKIQCVGRTSTLKIMKKKTYLGDIFAIEYRKCSKQKIMNLGTWLQRILKRKGPVSLLELFKTERTFCWKTHTLDPTDIHIHTPTHVNRYIRLNTDQSLLQIVLLW